MASAERQASAIFNDITYSIANLTADSAWYYIVSFDSSGSFSRPLIDPLTGRCIGVIAKDGTRHFAERVVMATGAWTPSLVDLEGQCVSKASIPCNTFSRLSSPLTRRDVTCDIMS